MAVMRKHREKTDIFWYGDYVRVEFDAKVFGKPENVRVEDLKP
jgi:hypothetical protein